MLKKAVTLTLLSSFIITPLLAQGISEEEYRNRQNYQRNRLSIIVKKRLVNVNRNYSYTDINSVSYTWEAYTFSESGIKSESVSRAEAKEITEWHIYKGDLREVSDLEFLALVGDEEMLARVQESEDQKGRMRFIGNTAIALGILTMLGGAASAAEQTTINSGAIATVIGFVISAFNLSPRHYFQPDYAQEKIDEYNLNLKKKLNLPLDYEG